MRRQFRWIVLAAGLAMWAVCPPAMAIGYLSGVLQKPAYVQTLTTLLGNAPSWTREILKRNGPYVSSPQFHEEIAGTRYELFNMCVRVAKCIDTSIVVMFAPNGTQAWAGLREKGVVSFLGAPSDAQQTVLKSELYIPEPPPKTGPYLPEMMKKNPAYARALNELLDHADKLPEWAQGMGRGKGWSVGSPVTNVTIDGTTYELLFTCESQNCSLSQLTVMFAPNATRAWGALYQEGTISYLGAPSAAQQGALRERLGDGNRK
ncbi:Ivy family c-type lysozyme inhibitor [Bradyrhizobium sp. 14AA]